MSNSNNQQNKELEGGDCQSVIEKTIAEMRTLLKIMVEALKVQPNIKNTIKKGLPRIVDQLEELESAVKSELHTAQQAARLFTPARRRAASTTAAEGTPTELVRDKKRGASSPPNMDTSKKPSKKKKADPSEEKWTVTNSKKGRKQQQQQQQQLQKQQLQQKQQKQMQEKKPKGTKLDAIVLKPAEGKTYADILSTIRTAVKPEDSGIEVRSIRQTRAGHVLLELRRSTTPSRASFSEALKGATGDDCTVEELVPRTVLEIRDLDSCTSEDEVKQALKRDLQDYNGILRSSLTQPNARKQRMAIVTVETSAANRLMATARIKVGWVNCRIRRRTTITRCFKCLGFDHLNLDCKGPDRSKLCFRCGGQSHKAKDCTAAPQCFLCPEQEDKADSRNHVAGSGACAVFRDVLEKTKQKWR